MYRECTSCKRETQKSPKHMFSDKKHLLAFTGGDRYINISNKSWLCNMSCCIKKQLIKATASWEYRYIYQTVHGSHYEH